MKCPKCQIENIGEFSIQGVTVNRCAACDGIWFDAHELNELLAEDARHVSALLRGQSQDQADGKKGQCPRDSSTLLRVYSSIDKSVIIDACPECHGIWLDGGEFEKLFAAKHS
jgi:Zn-finger nucleic acid-binding protein